MAFQPLPNDLFLFKVEQCLGQRKSRTIWWDGPPPERGSEVFLGKLPRNIFENVLLPLFSKVGLIYEMRILMDFSGGNRGFAFVQYANRGQALAAVKILNRHNINGHSILVTMSVDNRRLYITKLPVWKTRTEFEEELKRNVEGVAFLVAYRRTLDQKKMYAVVEFEDHRAAAMARRALVPGAVKLFGEIVQVEWADRRSRYGDKWAQTPSPQAVDPAPYMQDGCYSNKAKPGPNCHK